VSVPSPASDYLKALPLLMRSQDPSVARISVVYAKTGSFAAHVARGVADGAKAAGFDVIRLIPFDSPIRDARALLREALAAEPISWSGRSFQDDVVIVRHLDLASRVKTLAFVGAGLGPSMGKSGLWPKGDRTEPVGAGSLTGPLTGPDSEWFCSEFQTRFHQRPGTPPPRPSPSGSWSESAFGGQEAWKMSHSSGWPTPWRRRPSTEGSGWTG
jgi:predicted alpha/beta-fold hydrolase